MNLIGWLNFISGKPHKTTAKAEDFCVAYELDRADFFSLLSENLNELNADRLKANEMRERILLSGSETYNKGCLACDRLSHNVTECPRIHFKPKKAETIFLKEKYSNQKNIQKRKNKYNRANTKTNWKKTITDMNDKTSE